MFHNTGANGSRATLRAQKTPVGRPEGEAEHTRSELILARIRDTPPGFVRAYSDVSPGAPRLAGRLLRDCDDPTVPWHRIVRVDGSITQGARQRELLEAEGVPFNGDRVDMRQVRLPT